MGLKKFGRYAGVVAANAFIGGAGALSQEWKRDADDKRQLKKDEERAKLYDARQAGKDETADAKSNLENALKKLNASNITESEVDEVLRNYKGSEKDTAEVKNVAAAARKRAQGTAYRDIEENLSGRQAIADRETSLAEGGYTGSMGAALSPIGREKKDSAYRYTEGSVEEREKEVEGTKFGGFLSRAGFKEKARLDTERMINKPRKTQEEARDRVTGNLAKEAALTKTRGAVKHVRAGNIPTAGTTKYPSLGGIRHELTFEQFTGKTVQEGGVNPADIKDQDLRLLLNSIYKDQWNIDRRDTRIGNNSVKMAKISDELIRGVITRPEAKQKMEELLGRSEEGSLPYSIIQGNMEAMENGVPDQVIGDMNEFLTDYSKVRGSTPAAISFGYSDMITTLIENGTITPEEVGLPAVQKHLKKMSNIYTLIGRDNSAAYKELGKFKDLKGLSGSMQDQVVVGAIREQVSEAQVVKFYDNNLFSPEIQATFVSLGATATGDDDFIAALDEALASVFGPEVSGSLVNAITSSSRPLYGVEGVSPLAPVDVEAEMTPDKLDNAFLGDISKQENKSIMDVSSSILTLMKLGYRYRSTDPNEGSSEFPFSSEAPLNLKPYPLDDPEGEDPDPLINVNSPYGQID